MGRECGHGREKRTRGVIVLTAYTTLWPNSWSIIQLPSENWFSGLRPSSEIISSINFAFKPLHSHLMPLKHSIKQWNAFREFIIYEYCRRTMRPPTTTTGQDKWQWLKLGTLHPSPQSTHSHSLSIRPSFFGHDCTRSCKMHEEQLVVWH